MPKVSVIIPVYNVEQYLERCLDSVINQTLRDIEIICVNDGSRDGSRKILDDYMLRDSRIKIIDQYNQGLSAARNSGLRVARGEYIGFVDSDDWIDLNYYETLYEEATKNAADVSVATTNFISTEIISKNEHNTITRDFLSTLKLLKNGSVWDKLFSRKLIERANVTFPDGLYFEDNIFLIKTLYHANTVIFTNNTGYYYFQNPTGICRNISQSSIEKKRKGCHYNCIYAHKVLTKPNDHRRKKRNK